MKALRVLAATVAAWATALIAQATPPLPPAGLIVSAELGQQFGLALDGRALTWPVARQVHAGQLAPGWHRADVSLPAPYGPPVRFSTQVWLEAGRDNSYVLVLRRSGPQMLPVAPVAAPPYPGGGQYPPAGPAYPGGAYPGPSMPAPGGYPGGNGNGNYPGGNAYPGNGSYPAPGDNAPGTPGGSFPGNGGPGYPAGPGTGSNYPAPGGNTYPAPGTGSYPTQPMPGNNYPGGNGYPGGYPGPSGGYYPNGPRLQQLTPAEVARLQQSVSQRSFDDDRLAIIKQALSTSAVRADELTTLVRTLSFDRSRVELAKFGYAHVSDQQNFYRVYEALQYSSSVREVQDALGLPR